MKKEYQKPVVETINFVMEETIADSSEEEFEEFKLAARGVIGGSMTEEEIPEW